MLIEQVRVWLNGERDYKSGVALYAEIPNSDKKLLNLMLKGDSLFCIKKLNFCLENYYDTYVSDNNCEVIIQEVSSDKILAGANYTDTELYKKCKQDADLLYKETMNKRAILFNSIKGLGHDVNSAVNIESRRKLCIDVVSDFNNIGPLYDKAEFVAENGKLPYLPSEDFESDWYAIPDNLVKSSLDNLRKAFNKMKTLEQTSERIENQNKKEIGIKILKERWQSLKLVVKK